MNGMRVESNEQENDYSSDFETGSRGRTNVDKIITKFLGNDAYLKGECQAVFRSCSCSTQCPLFGDRILKR